MFLSFGGRISIYPHRIPKHVGYLFYLAPPLSFQDSARSLYYLYGGDMAQDGLLSLACLVTQCLYICPLCVQQSGCPFDDQGDDLCNDSLYVVCLYPEICF